MGQHRTVPLANCSGDLLPHVIHSRRPTGTVAPRIGRIERLKSAFVDLRRNSIHGAACAEYIFDGNLPGVVERAFVDCRSEESALHSSLAVALTIPPGFIGSSSLEQAKPAQWLIVLKVN
jgi:hypothetical protein